MQEVVVAQQGGFGPGGPPPGGFGAPPGGGYGPPGMGAPPPGAPPGMMPPGAPMPGQPAGFQATPGRQGSGFKYALIGCGCLALIAIAGIIFVLATGGIGAYMAKKATATGGADCAAAKACCKAVVAKSGAPDDSACNNFDNVPAMACTQALQTYKKSATALGISCP
jgi:hypothetical protein